MPKRREHELENPYQSTNNAPGAAASYGRHAPGIASGGTSFRWRASRYCVDAVVCGMPLINYVYVWCFWFLASMILGEWARPGIHDPSRFLMGVPHFVGMLLMLLSFAVAPITIAIGIRRRSAVQPFAYAVCLALSIFLVRLDIWNITSWIGD